MDVHQDLDEITRSLALGDEPAALLARLGQRGEDGRGVALGELAGVGGEMIEDWPHAAELHNALADLLRPLLSVMKGAQLAEDVHGSEVEALGRVIHPREGGEVQVVLRDEPAALKEQVRVEVEKKLLELLNRVLLRPKQAPRAAAGAVRIENLPG